MIVLLYLGIGFQEGKDVVARAKTGSGKTFAYLLPLLQKLFSASEESKKKLAPSVIILVPTRELSQQVYHFKKKFRFELCKALLYFLMSVVMELSL